MLVVQLLLPLEGGDQGRFTTTDAERWVNTRKLVLRVQARRKVYIGTCAFCTKAFGVTRSDGQYCSGRCRVAAHRRRRATDSAPRQPAAV